MATFFDHQIPEACEDEVASAYQFINSVAYQYGIEPADVSAIARSNSFNEAADYVERLKKTYFELRNVDTGALIESSVKAYNCTILLIVFGKAVEVAMCEWEKAHRMPEMGIWCSHPSNFDSLRTYVWAQKQFRLKVEVVAHRRLSRLSPIGTYLDAEADDFTFSLKPTPVEELIGWIRQEYKDHLGIFPIPG